jgi:Tol biopolymer transport system component
MTREWSRRLMWSLLLLGFAHGCGQDAPTETAADRNARPAASAAAERPPSRSPKGLDVTVSEGTNLSFALSPDGTTVIMSLQGVLFSLPVEGGTANAITGYYLDAREPSFAPDGNSVVFHGYRNGTWDLWSMPVGGGDQAPLTTDLFDDREAAFSPTGTEIAFSSDRDGNYDIWLYAVADGSLTQLTATPENEYAPAWSPDGAQVAYAAGPSATAADPTRTSLKRIEVATGIGTTGSRKPASSTASHGRGTGGRSPISWRDPARPSSDPSRPPAAPPPP